MHLGKCLSRNASTPGCDVHGGAWNHLCDGTLRRGKDHLLRLLLGLETPDEGSVRLPENCRWAAVFQEDRLLEHLDAWGNLHLIGTRQGEAAQPQCWQNWGWRRRRKDQCGSTPAECAGVWR